MYTVSFFCLKFYCLRWDHCFSLYFFLRRNWRLFYISHERRECITSICKINKINKAQSKFVLLLEANYPLSNGTDFQRKMEYKPFSRKVLKSLALLPVTWSFRLQNTWLRTKRFGANLTWWPNDRIPNFNGYSVHLSVEYTTKGKFCQAINICNLLFINFDLHNLSY